MTTVNKDNQVGETANTMVSDLATIVGREHVLASQPDRLAYQGDCWPRGIIRTRGRDLDHHCPAAIVQPASEDEVAALVRWARKTGTPLVPFGAGSGVCGGVLADDSKVIVDVKRMKQILETREDDLTVRVQAGAIGMPFEQELQRRGFTLGHFPSSIYCSSVGGWVAARGAGQFSSLYGKVEDMVTSVRAVTGTAEILDTAADALADRPRHQVSGTGGPDLTQLFVGSEGTMGVLTEASFNMARKPNHRFYRGFRFPDVETALSAIRDMMQAGLMPALVRLYDALDTFLHKSNGSKSSDKHDSSNIAPGLFRQLRKFAVDSVPEAVTSTLREQARKATHAVVGRVLGSPMTLNSLANVLPSDCLLIVGFEGSSPLIEDESQYAFDLLGRYGLDLGPEPGLHWLEHRYDTSYKQSPMFDAGAFVDTMEVSTSWSNVKNLYDTVREALSPHVLVMAHFSHVYPYGSSIYFTFTGFGADMDETLERYDTTWKVGLDAVASVGANVAHHHGVGEAKARWTHHDHRGGRQAFDGLKAAFDPDGIMNPGKVYR
jgi:alkyldihydroxyacetonephosphate synthase